MNVKKLIRWAIAIVIAAIVVVVAWETLRDRAIALIPTNTVEYVAAEQVPVTTEQVIQQQAESWLKSPEALEYAKKQVTADIVEELSKQ